jgi:hypothetical protein
MRSNEYFEAVKSHLEKEGFTEDITEANFVVPQDSDYVDFGELKSGILLQTVPAFGKTFEERNKEKEIIISLQNREIQTGLLQISSKELKGLASVQMRLLRLCNMENLLKMILVKPLLRRKIRRKALRKTSLTALRNQIKA